MNDGIENTVRTSETTLRVIDAVISIEEPRIKDVSEQLDISKSTALRHLTTLEKFDYVIKEEPSSTSSRSSDTRRTRRVAGVFRL